MTPSKTPTNETVNFADEELVFSEPIGLKTGLQKLDERYMFTPGFHLVVGPPGSGKSWFATWLIDVFWQYNKKRSVFFSLEMGKDLVKNRILQQWSQLTETEKKIKEPKRARELIGQKIFELNLFNNRTPQNFIQEVEKYISQGYEIFLLDHFHQIPGAKGENNSKVAQVWGEAFEYLRNTHKNIVLIIFAQPTKASFHKVALQMQDVSESASLIYKADTFLSISLGQIREDETLDTGNVERSRILWCDKNRLTGKAQVGARVYFAPDANFYESENDYSLLRSRNSDDVNGTLQTAHDVFWGGYRNG